VKSDDIQRVLILGAGIMGRQIGLQCARFGYEVRIYDIVPEALQSAEKQIETFAQEFVSEGMLSESEAAATLARITFTGDQALAAEEADLLSESLPEQPKLKGQVLGQFNALCPERTLFTTNSSSLVPSQFAAATGRPDRFCALHFHQPVWYANVVDIMPHPGTAAETVNLLYDFARRIDQIPIFVKREHPAYVFNAMLDAVLSSAMELAAEDVASVEEIDRAWMGITKMPIGPFGILDLVGIDLAYEITTQKTKWVSFFPKAKRVVNLLKVKVDQGHLGQKSGSGFYHYPHPVFEQPDFLTGPAPAAGTATAPDTD
jgi:3-hydroxybutyryl-CoA dehydrogenase